MSEIAIIGASSFLSKALIRNLPEKKVIKFDRSGKEGYYDYPNKSFQSGFNLKDILNAKLIYYCCGLGIQPNNSDKESLVYELNAFEPIRLINSLMAAGYQGKIITFGSYFEIGETNTKTSFDEGSFLKNTSAKPNAYCQSKSLLTKYINDKILQGNKQILHFILPNIYGAGENSHRLFPYIVSCMMNSKHMTFTASTQVRQFVHIDDVAELTTNTNISDKSGIFMLGAKARILKDIIMEAIDSLSTAGFNTSYEFKPMERRDTTMKYLAIDDSKAKKTLNWNPKRILSEEILKYLCK